MEDLDLRQAKEHLEDLVERAARGEDVRIVDPRFGDVCFSIAAQPRSTVGPRFPKRIPGLMAGKATISEADLFAPLSEDDLAWLSGESSA
jgi:antitoxin (DNA-binding transcriptional repressor) of toxin-antitoxin stability system